MLKHLRGWYFDKFGRLRECVVVNASMGIGQLAVIDAQTGEPVEGLAVEDVLTEQPE